MAQRLAQETGQPGQRRRKGSGPTLVERVRSLREAADLCQGRVPEKLITETNRVIDQADRRLEISGDATVVALAGATGSGKSSTFNAISNLDLATVGVRRPTTSQAFGASWGTESAEDLLDWLKIPRRHAIEGAESAHTQSELEGLVLLDLPDHDSTEVSHRVEVDRLVQLVDLMVWVVDPQKYADAALHDRYLKPLARQAGSMLVILNQVDKLTPVERDQCVTDLKRLLDSEGLSKVEVMAVSAVTGEGIEALRKRLGKLVAAKVAAAKRLMADVIGAAAELAEVSGTATAPGLSKAGVDRLNTHLGHAAGVPIVTEAVGNAWRHRGGLATGWPVLAWIAKFKPDPLRRLHLDRLRGGGKRKEIDPSRVGRTSLPATTGVQQARMDSAIRDLVDEAGAGMTRGWREAIKTAARAEQSTLPDTLDRTVATVDLDLAQHRRWWGLVRVLQWVLVATVVAGLLWLLSAGVLAYLQLPPLPQVRWWELPAPTVLAVGGVLAGLLLAGLARIGVEVGARRRRSKARSLLRTAIAKVTRTRITDPIQAELDRYENSRIALKRAVG